MKRNAARDRFKHEIAWKAFLENAPSVKKALELIGHDLPIPTSAAHHTELPFWSLCWESDMYSVELEVPVPVTLGPFEWFAKNKSTEEVARGDIELCPHYPSDTKGLLAFVALVNLTMHDRRVR